MNKFEQILLESIFHDPKLSASDSVAKLNDPTITPRAIDSIAHHYGTMTRHEINHPSQGRSKYSSHGMPQDMAHAILNHPTSSDDNKFVAGGSRHTDVLDRVTSKAHLEAHPSAALSVASNSHANAEHLDKITDHVVNHASSYTHAAAGYTIHHPKVTTGILNKFAQSHTHITNLTDIANHPKATAETLHHVATNKVLSKTNQGSGYEHHKANTLKAVLNNPETHSQTLRHIYDNHPEHRAAASAHANGAGLRNFGLPSA